MTDMPDWCFKPITSKVRVPELIDMLDASPYNGNLNHMVRADLVETLQRVRAIERERRFKQPKRPARSQRAGTITATEVNAMLRAMPPLDLA